MKPLLSLALFFLGTVLYGQNCHVLYPVQQPLDPIVCGQYQLTIGLNGPADADNYELRLPGIDTIVFDLDNIPVIGPLSESENYELSIARLGTTPCEESSTLEAGPIQDFFGGWNYGWPTDWVNESFCGLPTGEIVYWNDLPSPPNYAWYWLDEPQDTFPALETLTRDSLAAGIYTLRVFSTDGSDPCEHDYDFEVKAFSEDSYHLTNQCEDGTVNPAVSWVAPGGALFPDLSFVDGVIFDWYDLETGELLQSGSDPKLAVADEEGYVQHVYYDEIPGCEFRDTIFPDTIVPLDTYVIYETDVCFTNPNVELIFSPFFFNGIWYAPDGTQVGPFGPNFAAFGYGQWTVELAGYINGCRFVDTLFATAPGENCHIVSGQQFLDENDNCTFDAGVDFPMPYQTINLTNDLGEVFTALTDSEGFYELFVPTGLYDFTSNAIPELFSPCAATQLFIDQEFQSINLGYEAEQSCDRLEPLVSAPILRRCFENTVYVELCNNGSNSSEAGTYEVLLDPFLDFVPGSANPVSIMGDLLVFEHDSINPFECFNTQFRVEVSCDAALNQTHCISVTANYNNCPQEDFLDGAFLETGFICTDTGFVATIYNTGNEMMPDLVQYVIIEDGVMLLIPDDYQTSPPLEQGDSLVLPMPGQGPSYTLQVIQVNGAPGPDVLVEFMEGCADDFSVGFGNQLEQPTNYWEASICQANIGSYDPNDKAATPVGLGEEHYIQPRQELDYRIRFQNTGTDTAFTVVIRDTLSPLLDWSSLTLGTASHRYEAALDTSGLLTFTFNNIMLPDSFVNEPASNGFVRFKIKVKEDIPLPSTLLNRAGIYFDFNEPVITNTVMHTIDTGFLLLQVPVFGEQSLLSQLDISPNPNGNGLLNVNLSALAQPSAVHSLVIYNLWGQRVLEALVQGEQPQIELPDLSAGTYLIAAYDDGGYLLARERLVIQ